MKIGRVPFKSVSELAPITRHREEDWTVIDTGIYTNDFGEKTHRVVCKCKCGKTEIFTLRKFIGKQQLSCHECLRHECENDEQ